jgi:tripartite-type tricarboxylate transporter receptor subunit TctC
MLAPAQTPKAIVERLNRDIIEFLQTPEIRSAFHALGAEPSPGTPGEFNAFIIGETAKMREVIKLANLTPQ